MDDFQEPQVVRSIHSVNKIFIRIVNLTHCDVDIIWINFGGGYTKYEKLPSRSFIDVNTYETHPWIAIDSERKDRMLIDKQFVYMPKPWREFIRNRHPNAPIDSLPQNFNPRLIVAVTIPVYSLRYRTLLEVRSYLRDGDDVDGLDLPKHLQNDLKLLISERNRFTYNSLL